MRQKGLTEKFWISQNVWVGSFSTTSKNVPSLAILLLSIVFSLFRCHNVNSEFQVAESVTRWCNRLITFTVPPSRKLPCLFPYVMFYEDKHNNNYVRNEYIVVCLGIYAGTSCLVLNQKQLMVLDVQFCNMETIHAVLTSCFQRGNTFSFFSPLLMFMWSNQQEGVEKRLLVIIIEFKHITVFMRKVFFPVMFVFILVELLSGSNRFHSKLTNSSHAQSIQIAYPQSIYTLCLEPHTTLLLQSVMI